MPCRTARGYTSRERGSRINAHDVQRSCHHSGFKTPSLLGYWHKLKHTYGICFITLEKSNSAAGICSVNQLDRADPRNGGVVSDHLVGTPGGVLLRRVVYTNPADGVTYTYLTSDNTLPAYQIVLLYKHRWDIEKIFHQFKSKMCERKSWASSHEAKQSHAIFECLAHNLLLLFEEYIGRSEGLRDELEEKKQQGRSKVRGLASMASGVIRAAGNFINTALCRATQRTQRFIRWVRVWIYKRAPWRESLGRSRQVWGVTSA
jgi:Transposase DDE domain